MDGQENYESSDGEQAIDLTETLANISKNQQQQQQQHQALGLSDDDEDEFIRLSSKKANFKAGSKVLRATTNNNKKKNPATLTGGGSFQSLGLHPSLLRAILLRGFNSPTPIQRAALPHILASPPRDVVGMARTGSGKTLAYLIPLIQTLSGVHSVQFGIRALILVPTRELALQVLKVGKDLAKGFIQGDRSKPSTSQDSETNHKAEGLRWGLIVGGDSLEDQFTMFSTNPDVIIATPGRLLHLVVEMNLDLKSVAFVVFDEADRLFEMGFATQLEETLHRLPANRQTLLFSATLPKSLVEFAKAGLQNPKLIRLDSESKISSDLQMAFLSVKPIEKEAALLVLISNIVGVPKADTTEQPNESFNHQSQPNFSRGSGANLSKIRSKPTRELAAHQTIVFTATKHHVEYLGGLLVAAGYRVSLIYGALDQTARREQLDSFRLGQTNILVVTDLAARGIDIPILENVINYDFPSSARAFVHRVGRTARAGRKGWAYSLITQSELPFLMDLQLFLSRPLLACPLPANEDPSQTDFSSSLVIGTIPRELLDAETEYVRETLVSPNSALIALATVVKRAQKMYEKSQSTASNESHRRAKEFVLNGKGFSGAKNEEASIHLIFKDRKQELPSTQRGVKRTKKDDQTVKLRDQLLAKVNQFTPNETVFEIGTRGKGVAAQLMRDRRKSMGKKIAGSKEAAKLREDKLRAEQIVDPSPSLAKQTRPSGPSDKQVALVAATEGELEETFEMPRKKPKVKEGFRDPEAYLTYEQSGAAEEKGYNLNEGTSAEFVTQSKVALFDLGTNDEGKLACLSNAQKASQVKWDRKTKKFVKVGQVGQDNVKLVKTESGVKLPASFKTGSFDNWKKAQKIRIPNVGEQELQNTHPFNHLHRKFRHTSGAPNGPHDHQDRSTHSTGGRRDGRMEQNKRGKKVFTKTIDGQKKFLGPSHVVTRGPSSTSKSNFSGHARHNQHHKNSSNHHVSSSFSNKKGSASSSRNNNAGLKSVDQIRKSRELKERRKIRSNQPSRRKK
ncbi:ATP-dependent RNA helicase dbp10 [Puccinia graminis f. sp. tritici]|uniref:RNA helicase n=1 Tax=Puccinia graminis f. sp. tritici TaxID=56615 RepID=A0A5B0PAA5_PUCGR|nr:ATP-dependent RNA helicase dbp10 [Puccinia graminis f. sp. tritici]KAA1100374.1 ATP-dependent RNA helicase dbp10 [Puccinia graminis f. sp. tritici]